MYLTEPVPASSKMDFLLDKVDDDSTSGLTYLIKEKKHIKQQQLQREKRGLRL